MSIIGTDQLKVTLPAMGEWVQYTVTTTGAGLVQDTAANGAGSAPLSFQGICGSPDPSSGIEACIKGTSDPTSYVFRTADKTPPRITGADPIPLSCSASSIDTIDKNQVITLTFSEIIDSVVAGAVFEPLKSYKPAEPNVASVPATLTLDGAKTGGTLTPSKAPFSSLNPKPDR